MENIGWEIQPVGWILLFIVLAVLAYYLANRLQDPFDKNQ
jgi:hypothetical protein